MANYQELTRQLMPWLPAELANVFADAWAESGDPDLALAQMRSDPRYETFFPGNRRDDGSLYLDEQSYNATIEGYALRFAQYGLGGDFLREDYFRFIQAGVAPDELEQRLAQVYTEVIGRSNAVREYYAQHYGGGGLSSGNLSDRAIFASALNPSVSPLVYERQFRSAQIGGTASQFGFDIDVEEAERLYSFGLDNEAAQRLYSIATRQLPTLQNIQSRFDDPNDPLDISAFSNALVINDPEQLSTINRLMSQERASFASSRTGIDQMGRLTGLRRFR